MFLTCPDAPNLRAAMARTAYAAAIAHRDATRPGDPGDHDAVLAVGLRWSQLRYWERRAAMSRPGVASVSESAGTQRPDAGIVS